LPASPPAEIDCSAMPAAKGEVEVRAGYRLLADRATQFGTLGHGESTRMISQIKKLSLGNGRLHGLGSELIYEFQVSACSRVLCSFRVAGTYPTRADGGSGRAIVVNCGGQRGGLGACDVLLMKPEEIVAWAEEVRRGILGPFQINLWVPGPPPRRDPAHEARVREFLSAWGPPVPAQAGDAVRLDFSSPCEALLKAAPPIVSSIMGLYPQEFVKKSWSKGCKLAAIAAPSKPPRPRRRASRPFVAAACGGGCSEGAGGCDTRHCGWARSRGCARTWRQCGAGWDGVSDVSRGEDSPGLGECAVEGHARGHDADPRIHRACRTESCDGLRSRGGLTRSASTGSLSCAAGINSCDACGGAEDGRRATHASVGGTERRTGKGRASPGSGAEIVGGGAGTV